MRYLGFNFEGDFFFKPKFKISYSVFFNFIEFNLLYDFLISRN